MSMGLPAAPPLNRSSRMRRARCIFVGSPQGTTSEINVTPLVDVVLVLLIIFMVVTPILENEIPVQTQTESTDGPVVPVGPILVTLDRGCRVKLDADRLELPELGARLAERLQPREASDRIVFVVAHDDCPYADLVRVLDVARGAGAAVVGVPTDPADPALFL
jgi:biopolymer transport protein ExbD